MGGNLKQAKAGPSEVHDALPVGEVSDSTWDQWDDSVAFQDSQMPEAYYQAAPEAAPEAVSPPAASGSTPVDFDPFGSVHKNSG